MHDIGLRYQFWRSERAAATHSCAPVGRACAAPSSVGESGNCDIKDVSYPRLNISICEDSAYVGVGARYDLGAAWTSARASSHCHRGVTDP